MMAINFTKAIELQVVRKLKSHAKVGYQDHPNGDKRCSGCSMFVEGNPPACTHVAPPIASHGYCDDYEPLDPNARARAALGKAGSDDEPRDEHGRWTSGGGGGAEAQRNFSEQSDAFRLGFGSKPAAPNPFKDRPPLAAAWQRGHDKKHGASKRGVAKSFAEVMAKGSEDQPRDEHGRWATGSGVGQGTTRQSGRTGGRIA